jgi:hypothetical protein
MTSSDRQSTASVYQRRGSGIAASAVWDGAPPEAVPVVRGSVVFGAMVRGVVVGEDMGCPFDLID